MAEYIRVLRAAHAHFISKLALETTQKRVLLAMLKKKNRIRQKVGGTQMEWRLRFKEHSLQGVDDMEVLTWVRENTYQQATLPWRELVVKDVISRREVKLVKGKKEAIVDVYRDVMGRLKEDFSSGFADQLWIDGNAAGEKRFHGIESVMADDGATINTDLTAATSDTYAGLSTVRGNFGNTATDPGFGWFSPLLVNTGANGGSWAANCDDILHRAFVDTTFGNGSEGTVDVVILNKTSWVDMLNIIDGKERIIVGKDNDVTDLGFRSITWDSVPLTWDFGVPTTVSNPGALTVQGYGLNIDAIELLFAGNQGDICEGGVYYDEDQRSYKILVESLGNMKIDKPRRHFKLADYA